jgi:L-2-hydroxycarboxylate dehydrogenase (NAD+)
MGKKFIPFEVLEKFMVNVMVKAGIPEEDARIIGDVLLQADKFGVDSHGSKSLKEYLS